MIYPTIFCIILQAQLTLSTVAEEANLAKIQRLATSAAEMQAELAFRPTRADVNDLTAVVTKLRTDLQEREQQIERLRASTIRERITLDKAVETGGSLEDLRRDDDDSTTERSIDAGKISAEIDEMFRLDYEDDEEETDSAVTEINRDDDGEPAPTTDHDDHESSGELRGEEGDNGGVGSYVRLDDSQRLQVTLANGSLHALEEELVRAKERWAEVSAERARLAAQLALLQHKPRPALRTVLALAVPLLAVCLYYVLLPQLS